MAKYNIPYQNISVDVPDQGQVFRGVPGNSEDAVFVRSGNRLIYTTKAEFEAAGGNFNSLPQINPGSEGLNLLRTFAGGGVEKVGGSQVLNIPKVSGEVITQSVSSSNPQGADVTSNTSGNLYQSPSNAAQAQRFGVTPEALQQQQSGKTLSQVANDYLQKLYAQGYVINPAAQINAKTFAEFMDKASQEIDPYYASQFKLAKESFLRNVGYSTDEITRQEKDTEKKYGQKLRKLGEDFADTGFAQSGRRLESEQNLAEETQSDVDKARRNLSFNAGTAAREFTQSYGYGQTEIPGIGETPRVLAGQPSFQRENRNLPLYELSPSVYEGLVGTKQFEQRAAKQSRAYELEEAQRRQLSL